jgi:hypothetical protein
VSNTDESTTQVRIRRVPKIPVFIVGGAILGEIVTIILTASFPADPSVGFGAILGYFSIYGVTAGVAFGAIVAIVLDRILARRAKTLTATVDILEPEDEAVESVELPATELPTADAPDAGASN